MANVWPTASSFPQKPLLAGAQESDPQGVLIRTEMEVGPPKVRQRSTAGYERHTYTFRMTTTNKVAMKTFFASTCSHGAEIFEWDHPETATTEDWRFVSPPVYIPLGNSVYDCMVELEMLP